MEIPKLSVLHYIYNYLLLYMYTKTDKIGKKIRFDCLSVLAHENYICKLKQKKEN